MADSSEGHFEDQQVCLFTLLLILLIAGLVIHSFIIGVNVNDWWKGKSVTAVDHVVTSLGISRMCALCAGILHLFKVTFFLNSLDVTLVIMSRVYSFLVNANIWLTSLLSIVLCLKISNLHTRLFLYLRRMILHRTGHVIVASVTCSLLSSLIPFLLTTNKVSTGGTTNTTMDNLLGDCNNINSMYTVTIGAFFPVLFYSISSVLLFTSLYHHTTRMKMSSNLSINLETYYSVMKLISVTFIYNTEYFICHFASACYYYIYCVSLAWLYIILTLLPLLHSSYLIYGTAKLRNQMSKVLHNVIHLFFQKKDADNRENTGSVAL